jgi:uncharacterized protein
MLIDFEVGNYLSFKAPVRLSMVAANPIKEYLEENTFEAGRHRLLRSAVVYGANASGKSNLLAAMSFMKWFILNSSKDMQAQEEIKVTPFNLDAATEKAASHFEICFLVDDRRFRYGFEVDRKAVQREWLFCAEKIKEEPLFLRDGEDIDVSDDFAEGKGLEKNTRMNALFLSVVAQLNGQVAGKIMKWFWGFRALHGLRDERYGVYSAQALQDDELRPMLTELIRRADVGIEDMIVNEIADEEELFPGAGSGLGSGDLPTRKPLRPKSPRISAVHPKFRDGVKEGSVNLDFSTEESAGTRKLFNIAGPLLDCLRKGYVVGIDELDAKLHPLLTKAIVHLFNSSESNPRNAQLVFATHDTNLLTDGNLRRDQIWFTEKTQQAATDLYSLAEFKLPDGTKVRNDAAVEKNYIQGRYGAIPFLGDLGAILKEVGNGTSR